MQHPVHLLSSFEQHGAAASTPGRAGGHSERGLQHGLLRAEFIIQLKGQGRARQQLLNQRDPAAGEVAPPLTRPSRVPGRAGLRGLKFSHAVGVCRAGPASPRNLGRLVPAWSHPAERTFPGWVAWGQDRSGGRVGHGGGARPGPGGPGSVERCVAGRPWTPAGFPSVPLLTRSSPTWSLQDPAPRWVWGAAGEAPGSPPQEPRTQRGTQERKITSCLPVIGPWQASGILRSPRGLPGGGGRGDLDMQGE